MTVRKSIYVLAAGALLAASVPAYADHGRRHEVRHRHDKVVVVHHRQPVRRVVVERPVYVERKVVVERPVYVERPAPVYEPHYGYEPAYGYDNVGYEPVGHPAHREPNVVGAAAGAVVGAVIGSQIGHGHSRGATAAVGAVLGGVIGSRF